jgi:hypothetical protein
MMPRAIIRLWEQLMIHLTRRDTGGCLLFIDAPDAN